MHIHIYIGIHNSRLLREAAALQSKYYNYHIINYHIQLYALHLTR